MAQRQDTVVVWIDVTGTATAERLRRMLAGEGILPHGARPDRASAWVRITDRPPRDSRGKSQSPQGGIILLADSPTRGVDATLPRNVAARELAQVVHLVHALANLRRELAAVKVSANQWFTASRRDPLTGLANRRGWDEALRSLAAIPLPFPKRHCVAMADVDHFKQINAQHGHVVGDEVLRHAARTLRDTTRACDGVARLGGDEFGLLLHGVDRADAIAVLERIRNRFSHAPPSAGLPRATLSVGAALLPVKLDDQAIRRGQWNADKALREAKQGGRNRVVVHRFAAKS